MLLRDLDSSLVFVDDTGSLKYLPTTTGANAVFFECPCGEHHNLIAFEPTMDAALSPAGLSSNGGRWKLVSGTTVDDLTLSPSIAIRSRPGQTTEDCWHGFITDGKVT